MTNQRPQNDPPKDLCSHLRSVKFVDETHSWLYDASYFEKLGTINYADPQEHRLRQFADLIHGQLILTEIDDDIFEGIAMAFPEQQRLKSNLLQFWKDHKKFWPAPFGANLIITLASNSDLSLTDDAPLTTDSLEGELKAVFQTGNEDYLRLTCLNLIHFTRDEIIPNIILPAVQRCLDACGYIKKNFIIEDGLERAVRNFLDVIPYQNISDDDNDGNMPLNPTSPTLPVLPNPRGGHGRHLRLRRKTPPGTWNNTPAPTTGGKPIITTPTNTLVKIR